MNKKHWRVTATVAFMVMLVFNGLAGSTTLLNGWNTADVSAAYPTLFTPAGITFSIWGVIYLLLIGYTVFQLGLLGKISTDKDKLITKITPLYTVLSLVNTAWIFTWQYNVIWLSVLLIATMLVLLVKINESIQAHTYTRRENLLIRAPFSVYFGWITVATVANISVWLVSIDWGAWGVSPALWLVIILWVAAAVGMAGMLRNRDWLYGAVFVWAYCGILWKLMQTQMLPPYEATGVFANLLLLIVVLAMMSGFMLKEMRSSLVDK